MNGFELMPSDIKIGRGKVKLPPGLMGRSRPWVGQMLRWVKLGPVTIYYSLKKCCAFHVEGLGLFALDLRPKRVNNGKSIGIYDWDLSVLEMYYECKEPRLPADVWLERWRELVIPILGGKAP